ncbi:dihydrolipoyl dehydrogenase [Ectothiorhodospira variabilis]|nr:dihydrolipoyl dehydrogenase [Ectothiorhodospira variabilis]MCG5494140.1 dihydrolipoyl dehydrogenase [Ectothiorhodospira variabilis]MCG5497371.1 dihydrolipoyl dehydrogenase [Ectothiorhodospira variabilis]MCG5503330.1 dihydrolipoyl dehydrogenase [Ectothiorhodospira variabilis]MCG5506582.1 dihydrolipoyl dehydrogenase [Ectothiorhodospira variabilis]
MAKVVTIPVPDIGEFKDVEVIEVLVQPGDSVDVEDSLITLESDKASMDIPSPHAGTVKKVLLKAGDKVSKGGDILELEMADEGTQGDASGSSSSDDKSDAPEAQSGDTKSGKSAPKAASHTGDVDQRCQLLVLGSGPGGYTAAFRAADLGMDVIMVERYPVIGGVCLNVGCIPSKALLHSAQVIEEAEEFERHGIQFGKPEIDLKKLAGYKDGVVKKLTMGLKHLAKQRKVTVVQGVGRFTSPNTLAASSDEGEQVIGFEQAIVAVGSRPVHLPSFPWDDERVMDSTGALELRDIPERLLVVGGGIIGLEMACVYDALGSAVTVCELSSDLMPGADRDLVKPLEKRIKGRYENIFTGTKVTAAEATDEGIRVSFEGGKAPEQDTFDRVLVAVGRLPNGGGIEAEAAGLQVDEHGFIKVDKQMRTNVSHIFAIGDVVGGPMLAHKATHEAKVAAEVAAGQKSHFDARAIPSVAYTHPEVAWMGLTETEAKKQGIEYTKGVFPWAASGRAISVGGESGVTKLLLDEHNRVIGAGIVGPNAGELIAEPTLALEMGADVEDLGLTVHPHPTLSETVCFAAEVAHGSITDILPPRKK